MATALPNNILEMRIIQPALNLRPYIATFMIVESSEELINRVLPGTSVVMAIRYKGSVAVMHEDKRFQLSSFSITGLRKHSRIIHYAKESGNILVLFKEAGAAAFFRQPLHELFESDTPVDNLFGNSVISYIEEQLHEEVTIEGKIKIIERFLTSRLLSQKPDILVEHSIKKINAFNGLLKIKSLASDLNISHDAFEKRFRKIVGATPKQYASIVRMKSLIDNGPLDQSFTQLALDAGFFDQAHFIKEFKKFTGQTPSDFFHLPAAW